MADYKRMYTAMIDASERAIEALNRGDADGVAIILKAAEQKCEDIYIETEE